MKKLIIILSLTTTILFPRSDEELAEAVGQVRIGNLLLPDTQRPSPLFSVGQNILPKNELLLLFFADYLKGQNNKSNVMIPYLVYGITNRLSVFVDLLPHAARIQSDCEKSSGLIDTSVQFEYAFYLNVTKTYVNQITGIATYRIPTGSAVKSPRTGFGSSNFLLGTTLSHLDPTWYYFVSAETLLSTKLCNGTKFGNVFFYQGGLGRNIDTPNNTSILNWLIEFNGIYTQRDTVSGTVDPNTGGHVLYVGPSLWFSTPRTSLQVGIEFPVFQRFFGNQTGKNNFYLGFQLEWKFVDKTKKRTD